MRHDFPKRMQLSAFIALTASILCLSGCGGTPAPQLGLVDSTATIADGQDGYSPVSPKDYRINPADQIAVTVYREPDLSAPQVIIGSDGNLAIPLIGSIKAQGLTTEELADAITKRLAGGFLRNPSVSVNILEYASHIVTVEGSVEKTGVYQFKPGAKLSTAVSLASGPSRVARLDRVAVFRQSSEGLKVARFDYESIRQGTAMDPVLVPGDRVVVGTSGATQFWQDVLKTAPIFAVFFNAL